MVWKMKSKWWIRNAIIWNKQLNYLLFTVDRGRTSWTSGSGRRWRAARRRNCKRRELRNIRRAAPSEPSFWHLKLASLNEWLETVSLHSPCEALLSTFNILHVLQTSLFQPLKPLKCPLPDDDVDESNTVLVIFSIEQYYLQTYFLPVGTFWW